MQDFQSIPGLSGRIFSAGAGGMDNRRLRGYPSSSPSPSPPAPVKCPRCESANTKFCYYNNYNLSQPRHFCKACRRYWTKGGVLRNVPVGGGCRKSSSKRSSSSSSAGGASKPSKSSDKARRRPPASGGSSSDSSTLTANDASAPASGGALFTSQTSNPNPSPPPAFDPAAMEPIGQGPEIYGQDVGSFTTLMGSVAVPPPSSAPPTMLGFGYAHPPPPPASTMSAFRLPPYQKAAGMIDPTVQMDLPPFHGRSGGGGGMEWGTVDPTALFDLTAGSVDPAVYWSQTHWGDTDPSSLYLP